jgi:hypothetical protein
MTRRHDDVDIAVSLDDLARIGELLEKNGWAAHARTDEDGGTGYERTASGSSSPFSFGARTDASTRLSVTDTGAGRTDPFRAP